MRKMTATVCKRRTMKREQRRPPKSAVAVGGATRKDNGTGTLLRLGGNGNGTVEHLVTPPLPVVGQHHSQEEGCGSKMLSSCCNVDDNDDDGANDDGQFRMSIPLLINKQHNASFR
jgi:hypothetical protein